MCVFLFPLAQVLFFGTTDYRRAADVAVVFGAQVHDNGAPSTSLRDRMDTAVALYKDRLVKKVLVSGGVGDSGYNEALVMRDMAVKAGIHREDVIVDSSGVNTEATVRNSIPFFVARAAFARPGREPVLPPAAHQAGLPEGRLGRAHRAGRHVDAHQGDAAAGAARGAGLLGVLPARDLRSQARRPPALC